MMASQHIHMSRGAAETSEFVVRAAFLDLQKEGCRNNKKLVEFVRNCYVNTLKMADFCASLFERLRVRNHTQSQLIHEMLCFHAARDNEEACCFQLVREWDDHAYAFIFFHELSRLYAQQLMMRELLQSFHNSSVEKLDAIDNWMKVSAVFFTAAAAITAGGAVNSVSGKLAAAAAGTSVMFLALGKWIHSLQQKRESAVKEHMKIIGVMNMVAELIIKDLSSIHAAALTLQFQTESLSEIMAESDDDVNNVIRKKVAAVKKSFQELRGKTDDFSRDMRWARNIVLHNIITHSD